MALLIRSFDLLESWSVPVHTDGPMLAIRNLRDQRKGNYHVPPCQPFAIGPKAFHGIMYQVRIPVDSITVPFSPSRNINQRSLRCPENAFASASLSFVPCRSWYILAT
jgi:hypothetical protein